MQSPPPDSHRTDRVDYFHAGVQPGPQVSFRVPAGRSAAPEPPAVLVLQMSHDTFTREMFCSHQTRADFSAAQPPGMLFDSDPQSHRSVSNLVSPPRPAVCPSPLDLRRLSSAPAMVLAEPRPMLSSPYAPQDPHQTFLPLWPGLVPNIGPCVLSPFSCPVQFWCGPYSPPGPWFFHPEHHPSRCLCPLPSVQQSFSPVLVSTTTNINVRNEMMAPASVMNQRAIETEDEHHEGVWPQSTEAGGRHPEQDGGELQVSAARPVDRQEDRINTLRSLSPKIKENDEDELETEVTGNGSFLDYLNDLCRENFVRNVESILNTDFLNWLLSSDPESFNFSELETQNQKDSSSPSRLDGSPLCLNSDPNLNQTREDSPEAGRSPLLPSHILEEQAEGLMNRSPYGEETCSVGLDHMTLSNKEPEHDHRFHAVPLDLVTVKGHRRRHNRAEKSKKSRTFTYKEESSFNLVQDDMESETKPKISIVLRHCPRLPGQSEKEDRYVVVTPERSRTEDHLWKMDEFTSNRDLRNYKPSRRQFSGRKLVCEKEESDRRETSAAERSEKAERKKQNLKRTRVQTGKPLSLWKKMSATLFTTQDENQRAEVVTSSSATEDKVQPTKARGRKSKKDLETESEPVSLFAERPVKRRKPKGESSEVRSSGNPSLTQTNKQPRVRGRSKASGNPPVEKRRKPKCPPKKPKSTSERSLDCFVSCNKWSQEAWKQSLETKPKHLKSNASKANINRAAIKRKPSPEQATPTGPVRFEGPAKKRIRCETNKTKRRQNKMQN